MSDEQPNVGEFLLRTRELVAAGKSAYGDPNSPAAQAQLAELDARLEHHRHMGEAPPPTPPWTQERVAAERLAAEHPLGDPAAVTIPAALAEHWDRQFDALAELDGLRFAKACDAVAQDIAGRASEVTFRHGAYNPGNGRYASPHEIVEALVKDAEPAVRAIAEDQKTATTMLKLIRADRKLLELFASRGQARQAYQASKKRYGL